ncbi:thioredoxin-disulfide reductase [Clostridium sp. DL1XJH146]
MNKEIKELDLIIIGAGPAGLTAAIYAARAKLDFVLIEDEIIGGQIKNSYSIENYPGFNNISGDKLSQKMLDQAENLGANIDEFDKIISVILNDKEKIIETESYIYKPKAVIIAAGSKYRELPVEEEPKFHGKGIHYCELCDGKMYEGKDIIVVGGGNSAVQGALFLTRYVKSITMIHQLDNLQADKANQEELLKNEKVNIIWDSEVRKVMGEEEVQSAIIQNLKTKEEEEIKVDGIFVYIGMAPRTNIFKKFIKLDHRGNIIAGEDTKTNVEAVYAAGDVRTKKYRQLTTAVSDGTIATLSVAQYVLNNKKEK